MEQHHPLASQQQAHWQHFPQNLAASVPLGCVNDSRKCKYGRDWLCWRTQRPEASLDSCLAMFVLGCMWVCMCVFVLMLCACVCVCVCLEVHAYTEAIVFTSCNSRKSGFLLSISWLFICPSITSKKRKLPFLCYILSAMV